MKKKCKKGEVIVYTETDLVEAIRRRQERIVVSGKVSKKVLRNKNGGHKAKKVLGAGSVATSGVAATVISALGVHMFAPIAIPLMVGGILLSSKDYEDYEVKEQGNDKVVIELKSEIKLKAVWE